MTEKWLKTEEAIRALGYKNRLSLLHKREGKPYGFLKYGEHWRIRLDGRVHYEWNIEAVRTAIANKPDMRDEARRLELHRKYLERVRNNSGIISEDPTQDQ